MALHPVLIEKGNFGAPASPYAMGPGMPLAELLKGTCEVDETYVDLFVAETFIAPARSQKAGQILAAIPRLAGHPE